MAIWLVRAGNHGQYEQKFIQEKRVYVTWDKLDVNLARLPDRHALQSAMVERYPDTKPKAVVNWVSQVWPFAHSIEKGDWVVVPLKTQPAIQIGEIIGNYHFEASGPDPFYHWRPVKWIAEAVPRTNFGQDLLYSFGAFMTICRIQRNSAEARLKAMQDRGWTPEKITDVIESAEESSDEELDSTNLEELANDQIDKLISARFSGHKLATLVEAILKAQGYTTYRSPEGPDGGVDILAGTGPLGFGAPRLCVEVKSDAKPIDRPTVDKLLGAVSKFGASEGLFVSWSGFKPNVQKELASTFFRLRLWTRKELLEQLFAHYADLDEDLRAELPLKRIWSVAVPGEE
jgi:restriction system protein